MPFCSNCGKFSVVLTQQKLCHLCNKLVVEGKISEDQFRKHQSRLHDEAAIYMTMQDQQGTHPLEPEREAPSPQDPHPYQQGYLEPDNGVANIAFGLIIIAFIMLFLNLIIVSGVVNACGLFLAIVAKRRELTPNMRSQLALGIGVLFWGVFIFFVVISLGGII